MMFMTRKRFRKMLDEAMEDRRAEAERREIELTRYRNPNTEPENLYVVTVYQIQGSTDDPKVIDVRVRRKSDAPFHIRDQYETVSAATLTDVLSQILRALHSLGVEVAHVPARYPSWSLRKPEPATKERVK